MIQLDAQDRGVLSSTELPREYAHGLMVTALQSYQSLKKRRGPLATTLIRIYRSFKQYARAVDVFIQCDPTIAALVWGSVRILLQVND